MSALAAPALSWTGAAATEGDANRAIVLSVVRTMLN
jgi:hypothetical protein